MSTSSPAFVIRGEGGDFLEVSAGFRAHGDADDYWDGNWIAARVRIRTGGFEGEASPSLRAEEFEPFRDGLRAAYDDLSGPALFQTMEEWLEIRVVGDGRGHFRVRGFVTDQAGGGNRLDFGLCFDQTEIPRLVRELDAFIAAFPVVGER